ncbi:lipopolysaccharide biosynthesis protein [Geodermatophilus sp. SYSU D01106]
MFVALLSARWLGPGDRGDLVLATTLATLLLLVSSLGAGNASRVLLAEVGRWWSWSRYTCLSFALAVPHLVISGTVGLLVLSWLSTADRAVAVAFVVYSVPALVAHLLREGLHGLGRHRSSLAIAVGNAAGQLLCITGAHLLGVLTAQTALYSFALCNTVSVVVQFAVGRAADASSGGLPASTRDWWRQAGHFLAFSRFALVSALGQSFVVNGDRLILGAHGSSSEVGIYAAASSLAQLTYIAPVALTAVLTRRIAATGTLDPWRRMYRPVLVLSGSLAVVVAGLGWFAIPLLLGADFSSARSILPVLCAAGIPYASYHFDSAACAGLRDLRTGAWGALLGCAVLVLSTTVAEPLVGTAGIPYCVLLTYTVMAVTARSRVTSRRTRGLETPTGDTHP